MRQGLAVLCSVMLGVASYPADASVRNAGPQAVHPPCWTHDALANPALYGGQRPPARRDIVLGILDLMATRVAMAEVTPSRHVLLQRLKEIVDVLKDQGTAGFHVHREGHGVEDYFISLIKKEHATLHWNEKLALLLNKTTRKQFELRI